MRTLLIISAAIFAFSGSAACAHGYKPRHHHYFMHRSSGGPNGTPGGWTSRSGTGSSKFGGQVPGATGHY